MTGCSPSRWRSSQATDDFALQPSRRYAHAEAYVRRVLEAAELSVLSLDEKIIRQDRNEPVTGLIVTARRLDGRSFS